MRARSCLVLLSTLLSVSLAAGPALAQEDPQWMDDGSGEFAVIDDPLVANPDLTSDPLPADAGSGTDAGAGTAPVVNPDVDSAPTSGPAADAAADPAADPAPAPASGAIAGGMNASQPEPAAGSEPDAQEQAPSTSTSRFVPLAPTRVLDTREGKGAAKAKVAPKGSVVLQVTGAGGIPATGVTAVVMNVTLTAATGPGFVQVYPTGRASEGASSNLNVQTVGQTVPVLVTAPVGDGGRVTLYTHGGGHLLADLAGYFLSSGETAAGRYRPLTPERILDTRAGLGAPKGLVARGTAVTVQVAGRGGIPTSGVSAVALNVTATGAPASGFVQVVPSAGETAAGASSNLNVVARQTVANLVVVPLGDNGAVDVYSANGSHVLADVAGWFTDGTAPNSKNGLFVPVGPKRLLDTRETGKPGDGAQVPLVPLGQAGIPSSGVSSVVLHVTATLPSAGGFVQVLPTGQGKVGASSNLNVDRVGQTVANAALATLGDGGSVTLYTLRSTHLLADVAGWFTGADASSGALPAELQGLRVAPRSAAPYDRAAWPHWADADGNCLDTAEEVMLAESSFEMLTDDRCAVDQGDWVDPWTGAEHGFPGEVAVVHAVPLPIAHASGGSTWDAAKRSAFANDVSADEHLLVVGTDSATARDDRAPEAWQPAQGRCGYARAWASVKKRWDLTVTQAELDALRAMLASC